MTQHKPDSGARGEPVTLCEQVGCQLPARYRYIWPGHDESRCCEWHANGLRAVARALGFHLQLVDLPGGER